jgi:hypothetical protein
MRSLWWTYPPTSKCGQQPLRKGSRRARLIFDKRVGDCDQRELVKAAVPPWLAAVGVMKPGWFAER